MSLSLAEALATFAVEAVPTAEELPALYRLLAKGAHPDAGGSDEAMQRLNAAKLVLEAAEPGSTADTERVRCAFCRGTGSIRHGFTSKQCSVCDGTGYVKASAASTVEADAAGYDPVADMVADMPAHLSVDFKRRLARRLYNSGWRKPQ